MAKASGKKKHQRK